MLARLVVGCALALSANYSEKSFWPIQGVNLQVDMTRLTLVVKTRYLLKRTGVILQYSRSFIKAKKPCEFRIWEMREGVDTMIHFVIANRQLLLTDKFGVVSFVALGT